MIGGEVEWSRAAVRNCTHQVTYADSAAALAAHLLEGQLPSSSIPGQHMVSVSQIRHAHAAAALDLYNGARGEAAAQGSCAFATCARSGPVARISI